MSELTTGHLRGIEQAIARLGNVTEVVARQVDVVQHQQVEIDTRLVSLSAQFEEFLRADTLAKELNLAETRIVKVRNEIDTEFGHYGEVRRRATGVLQALDLGIVSHETIQDTTEDVMVATPRYWLAPALVALAAWSRDDRPLAENALGEALRRDSAKTSLFLSLVLRRYRRGAAAARWLGQFLARQDPTALGREFIVVLDAVASGAYGLEGRAVASAEIDRWLSDLAQQQGFVQRQVDRWRDALLALAPDPVTGRFPHLEQHSPQWPGLSGALVAARLHDAVIAHFGAIFEGELLLPSSLERAMDELLERLVKDFDVEELPLRQAEAELQAIINHGGDRLIARADAQLSQAALTETIDFPSLLTNAAMRPAEAGASRGSERLAVALSREWIIAAYDTVAAEGRNSTPSPVELNIEGWVGTIDDDSEADRLMASLHSTIDAETALAVAGVKFGGIGLGAAIVGGLVLLIGLVSVAPVVIVLGLAVAGYGLWDYRQLDKRRGEQRARGEERKKMASQKLQAALAEFVDYQDEWRTADARAEVAREMLVAISPIDQQSMLAHDAREVV
jgi:hypothetical protein